MRCVGDVEGFGPELDADPLVDLEPAEDASCTGVVYRIAPGAAAEGLEDLWAMEMHTGVYRPAWVDVETPVGSEQALTFVVRRSHPQYAGNLSAGDAARIIADAEGENGTCRDYLEQTIRSLARHGITDPAMETLRDMVGELSPER